MAGGLEVDVDSAQLERDLGAVGLVTDDDDRSRQALERRQDARRAGDEPVVDTQLRVGRLGDRGCCIAGAEERARQDELRCVGRELFGERPSFLASPCAERAKLVRVAGIRMGVAHEDQPHGREDRFRAMRTFRYVLADVFTDRALSGNQLAVFTDARDLDEVTMQALALELGFSETVFVLPPREGGTVRLRIFTPSHEMQFAGHPCLGAAFVLGAPLQLGVVVLETPAGQVPVELERDASGAITFGRMTQPVPTIALYERPDELLTALGVEGSELPLEVYDNGARHAFVVLPAKEDVARVAADMSALAGHELIGAVVCAGSGASWKLRMFSPVPGMGEDAATGSAAGPLACHLARHGVVPWGTEIEVEQGTEIGRTSKLFARAEGDEDEIATVVVGGSAVTVARGEFRVP